VREGGSFDFVNGEAGDSARDQRIHQLHQQQPMTSGNQVGYGHQQDNEPQDYNLDRSQPPRFYSTQTQMYHEATPSGARSNFPAQSSPNYRHPTSVNNSPTPYQLQQQHQQRGTQRGNHQEEGGQFMLSHDPVSLQTHPQDSSPSSDLHRPYDINRQQQAQHQHQSHSQHQTPHQQQPHQQQAQQQQQQVVDPGNGVSGGFEMSIFKTRYQRNNKRGGLKNLRCFPSCGFRHKVHIMIRLVKFPLVLQWLFLCPAATQFCTNAGVPSFPFE